MKITYPLIIVQRHMMGGGGTGTGAALLCTTYYNIIDGWLRMGSPPPPLGNFADISYLVEN